MHNCHWENPSICPCIIFLAIFHRSRTGIFPTFLCLSSQRWWRTSTSTTFGIGFLHFQTRCFRLQSVKARKASIGSSIWNHDYERIFCILFIHAFTWIHMGSPFDIFCFLYKRFVCRNIISDFKNTCKEIYGYVTILLILPRHLRILWSLELDGLKDNLQ